MRNKPSRKLLSGKVGVATLALVGAATFPGCNLLPPPPCDDADPRCASTTDAADRDAPSNDAADPAPDDATPDM